MAFLANNSGAINDLPAFGLRKHGSNISVNPDALKRAGYFSR
jgi:hypothetical protein